MQKKKFNNEKKTLFKPGTKVEFDWVDLNEESETIKVSQKFLKE